MHIDIAILAGVMAAVYGAMKAVMDSVFVLDNKRDLILDIDKEGLRLDPSRKIHLLDADVKPLVVGLATFILLYAVAMFAIGIAVICGRFEGVHWSVSVLLFLAGIAFSYVLWVIITENYVCIRLMRRYIKAMPDRPIPISPEPPLSPLPLDPDDTLLKNYFGRWFKEERTFRRHAAPKLAPINPPGRTCSRGRKRRR